MMEFCEREGSFTVCQSKRGRLRVAEMTQLPLKLEVLSFVWYGQICNLESDEQTLLCHFITPSHINVSFSKPFLGGNL